MCSIAIIGWRNVSINSNLILNDKFISTTMKHCSLWPPFALMFFLPFVCIAQTDTTTTFDLQPVPVIYHGDTLFSVYGRIGPFSAEAVVQEYNLDPQQTGT